MSVVRFDEDKKKWRFDRRTGGTRRVTFHESEKEAQKLKEEFDLAKKGYVAAEKVVRLKRAGDVREATGEAVPIGDALARYSEIEMPKKKPKTQVHDKKALNDWYDWLYDVARISYMDEITVLILERYQAHLKEIRKLAGSTVNRQMVPVKHFLNKARKWKLMRENVTSDVERVEEVMTARRVWTDEEVEKMTRAATPWLRDFIRALDVSGLRPGMLGALTFGDVDLERGEYRWSSSKGGRTREFDVPMHPRFAALVKERIELAKRERIFGEKRPVFVNQRKRPITEDCLVQAIQRARKKAGLSDELTAYGLRHKFGTDLDESGASMKQIAALMGHAKITTTARYVRTKDDVLRAALERREARRSVAGNQKMVTTEENGYQRGNADNREGSNYVN